MSSSWGTIHPPFHQVCQSSPHGWQECWTQADCPKCLFQLASLVSFTAQGGILEIPLDPAGEEEPADDAWDCKTHQHPSTWDAL